MPVHTDQQTAKHGLRSMSDFAAASLKNQHRANSAKKEESAKLQHRLTSVRKRIDQAYMDKMDATISAEFWQRMTAEWQMGERQILLPMQGLGP